ncbi:hypothetical protein SPFM15_00161 [Salmonella phage SPFM15]|nr:hypothetical protein SPFM5_00156 [Salmonella phage SPFM5]VFR13785.1 hypothetical protein SPFM15_00161 [Salmonella phage SPFM15]
MNSILTTSLDEETVLCIGDDAVLTYGDSPAWTATFTFTAFNEKEAVAISTGVITPTNEPLIAPMSDDYADLATVVNQLCGLNLSREDANKIIDPQGPILVTVAPGDTIAKARKPNGKKITVYYDRLAISGVGPIDLGVESARTTQAYLVVALINHDNGLSLSPDEIVFLEALMADRYQPDLTLSSKAALTPYE